jgi:hypothetical protein
MKRPVYDYTRAVADQSPVGKYALSKVSMCRAFLIGYDRACSALREIKFIERIHGMNSEAVDLVYGGLERGIESQLRHLRVSILGSVEYLKLPKRQEAMLRHSACSLALWAAEEVVGRPLTNVQAVV